MESSRIRLAADVGGTFTDIAAFDETTGELCLGKTLTTPARLVTGVENRVTKAGAGPESYNLFFRRHRPLIERDLRYEIRERMDAHGKVLIELDEDQVRAAVADAVRKA